ncbi:sugar transferase [Ferruginibacter albus]|uniref:sugar transferase n=1 Tax=Ferruginibacter albus TaxID=2875540 RepID=UPI001CC48427|nr:sugar transferase [Ferruginibacter albus]UAY52243.1 sugar transferase [Ferruginibacter albus]
MVTINDSVNYLSVQEIPVIKLLVKRIIDILFSLVLLPLALPIILLACLAMWISSGGPLIFKQKRVGLNGKIFTIYKIRTMVHCPEGYVDFTRKNDSRITKVGLFLRKLKIDELPQLFNVLKGDMSWIGPRPERVEIVEKYIQANNSYQYRHIIKPGITGLAQVNNPTATPEENLVKLQYDLYYINNYSVKLDFQILAKTINVVTTMEGL